MELVEQIAAIVPYGETVLHKAEGVYGYSKDKTKRVYEQTRGKIIQTRDGYIEFRKNVEKFIFNVAQETVNEMIGRTENFVGVKSDQRNPEDLKHVRERIMKIAEIVYKEHFLRSRVMTNQNVKALIKMGRNFTIDYLIPLYINIRATLIVTWEMLIEFLESRLKDFKMSYESSKDHIIMYISGNFNEENLK